MNIKKSLEITKNKKDKDIKCFHQKSKNKKKLIKKKKEIESSNSLLKFYLKIIKLEGKDLINSIKDYIKLIKINKFINKLSSINEMRNLIYFLIVLSKIDSSEKRLFYPLLKEIILEQPFVIQLILQKFPPTFGNLININDISIDCLIDQDILDRFKFLLNIVDKIDLQIEKGELYFENNKNILLSNKINNNNQFIESIKKKYILDMEILYINTLLIVNNEGIFKY